MIIIKNIAKVGVSILKKKFCERKTQGETHIYIFNDKFSIKPNQEYRVYYEFKSKNNEEGREQLDEVVKFEKYRVDVFPPKEISDKKENFYSNYFRRFHHIFLPRDFPVSVKPGYYDFSKYLFISSVCFNIMNFLSTQALINSLGLTISPIKRYAFSAGLNWVIKDGIGQIGSIFFAAKYSHQMETNLKKWRVIATLLLNISVFMEILTVIQPQHFLIIASLANIIKLTSLTIFGVTRAGIILHLTKENNVTDLTNKATTQQNLSILLGNLIGFGASMLLPETFPIFFSAISIVTILHIYTGIKSVKSIIFDDLNLQRLFILCEEYLDKMHIISPSKVCNMENIFCSKMKNLCFCQKSLDHLLIHSRDKDNKYLINLLNLFKNQNFFCYVVKYFSPKDFCYKFRIYINLRVDSDDCVIIQSFLFAVRLNRMLNIMKCKDIIKAIEENLKFIEKINLKEMIKEMKNIGWNVNFYNLEEKFCRYNILYK